VLFDGVVHRQVVLLVPKEIRPLFLAEPKLLNAFADAEARAVQQLVARSRRWFCVLVGFVSFLLVRGRARFCLPLGFCGRCVFGAGLRRLAYGLRGAGTLKGRRGALVFA